MSKVYYKAVKDYSLTKEISDSGKELLERLIKDENIKLEKTVPVKVHFGEKGNTTYIHPANFEGILGSLKKRGVSSFYVETNAVYSGHRMDQKSHAALAKEHGFTQLPIKIADGDHGDEYEEVRIDQKHFKTAKIGRKFTRHKQVLVISHFKGHGIAGYGGALKQLGMGFAARGGKLAMHVDAKPFIIPFRCKKCHACVSKCPVNAINVDRFLPAIDHSKCIGCASCIALCRHKAIFVNFLKVNMAGRFREKLAEYAYAAHHGKRNIYITYAFNLTKGCDCIGQKMVPVARDLGIFASADPVAIDACCLDMADKAEGRKVFKGREILAYAEKISIGSAKYELKQ